MFNKTLRTVADRLAEAIQLVHDLDRRLDKLEVIALVREPSVVAAADAYDGLRKQVVASATARWTHLAQLAQLDAALAQGADLEVVGALVEGWITQAALDRVSDPGHPEADLLYELVENLGGPLAVLEPAYVDGVTGRLVRPGRAHRAETAPQVPTPERTEPAPGTEQAVSVEPVPAAAPKRAARAKRSDRPVDGAAASPSSPALDPDPDPDPDPDTDPGAGAGADPEVTGDPAGVRPGSAADRVQEGG
ncbi:hypothetical protein ACWDR3_00635 [Streptomyces sp. NPDC001002]